MAQTSHSQPISAQVSADRMSGRLSTSRNLALRRLAAWGLELGLLVGSVAIPWSLGEVARQHATAKTVPLNVGVVVARSAIARPLGLPRYRLVTEVPILTNILWFSALVLPVAVAGSYIYGLATWGKTWPKALLGLQVVDQRRPVPGLRAILGREAGRWGVPAIGAYALWLVSGAFPNLLLLGGLTVVCTVGLAALRQRYSPYQAWYDRMVGTRVVLLLGGLLPIRSSPHGETSFEGHVPPGHGATPLSLAAAPLVGLTTEEYGGLTAIVLSPADSAQILGPKDWRQHLPVVGSVLAGMVFLAGIGALWLDRRLPSAKGNEDALFLALVENLSRRATSFSDRQAAALALASTQDPRAIPLLVDMLAQTGDPSLLDTLQQALVTLGPPAIPPLQRLNLALANDLLALPPDQQLGTQMRQRAVKRTLAKILVLHNGSLNGVDLSGTNLGSVVESPDAFTLVLEQQNLAGIVWRNAVLSGARCRKAKFFAAGADGHSDTFDDWVTDFSGSDLTEASLVAAQLQYTIFRNTSLLRANLSNAVASYADFSGANASSAWFIAADVHNGAFKGTSLVGTDFTDANLTQSNLVEARLRQATLIATQLTAANLTQADLSEANLNEADLTTANLSQANLSNARLQGADLSQANLEGANLAGANLEGTLLTGANLAGVNLAGAQFFAPERSQGDDFVARAAEPDTGSALAGVDFSKTLNLQADQLEYICAQGGIHPACRSGVSAGGDAG
ncbi:pentapeptide repeat-containing protein [Nodosilinea nodulosa]|uniref:pentapeptide repeat-containing protein n=1 Tax=Nodosilinea nodulosa TaxID=416001 RepID=UPI0002F19077|nr:pentapeptide repeat-containing protein [Nodosilinea nodulosa]